MSEIKIDKSVLRVYKNLLVKKFFNESFEIVENSGRSYIKYINEILNIKDTIDIKDMIYNYINEKNGKYLEYKISANIDDYYNRNYSFYYNENDIQQVYFSEKTSLNIQNNLLNETEIEEIKELSDKLNNNYYNKGMIGLMFCMIEDESKNYLIKNNFFNFLTDEINNILDIHHLYEYDLNKIIKNDFYNASDYVDNLCYKLRRYIKVIFDNKDIIYNFDKEKFYEDIKKIINHINNIRVNLVKGYFICNINGKCVLSTHASKIYSYLRENICVFIFDEALKNKYSEDFEYFNNFACKDFYNSFYSYLSESSSEIKELFISKFLLKILYENSKKEEKIYLIDTINEYCSDSEILQEVFKYSMENEEG